MNKKHFKSVSFTAHLRLVLFIGALVMAGMGVTWAHASGSKAVYRVAKFEIWAKANNGVEAKKIALQDGRRAAFRYLYERITLLKMRSKLPKLDDRALNRLVSSISIGKEQNSSTQYLATVDYQFNPSAVAALLREREIGFVDHQSPRVTILPLIDPSLSDTIANHDLIAIRKEWNLSFASLDKHNGLVPIRVLTSSDKIDTEVTKAIMSGDAQTFKNLQRVYKTDSLLLVHLAAGSNKGEVRLLVDGVDAVGSVSHRKNFARKERKLGVFLDDLSDYAHGVVTARWKLFQGKNPGKNGVLSSNGAASSQGFQTSVRGTDGTKIEETGTVSAPRKSEKQVKFRVQFSGLREWTAIRRNLKSIRGVGDISIQSLSARAAQISVAYQGKQDQFFQALPSHRLAAFRQQGKWYLMSQ